MNRTTKSRKNPNARKKRKLTDTCRYWKLISTNMQRGKKKLKNISGKQENYLKLNYIAEISSKR